jgi:hypothetical protein
MTVWTVDAVSDCVVLCTIFDHFPLRAKKADDYVIWREALYLKASHRGRGYRFPRVLFERLADLQRQMDAGRAYDPEEAAEIMASTNGSDQLSLWPDEEYQETGSNGNGQGICRPHELPRGLS